MTRVLVLGRTGMLGGMVYRVLRRSPVLEVRASHRRRRSEPWFFEAAEGRDGLRRLWDASGGFAYVVNCVGVTKASLDERDPSSVETAILVNALLPLRLGAFAAEVGARVIHMSTDGVFSGREGPYAEDDPQDCTDVYGKSKSVGEVLAPHVLNLRSSLIGPDPVGHRGLLEWFLALSDGKQVVGYTDHRWNGVTSLQLADACLRIIADERFDALVHESSVHHFCPNRAVSKYELLCAFNEVFGRRVAVVPGSGPDGPVTRVLASRYRGLKELFGAEQDIIGPLRQLAEAMARAASEGEDE